MATSNISTVISAYISGAWVELNALTPARAHWGISGNRPTDRLADVGELTFALDNSAGLYSPGAATALAGWEKGLPVKMVVTFEGEDFVRFRGNITDIQIRPAHKDHRAYVTVSDWLDYAARHPVVNPAVQTSKRADQVITTLLTELEVQPQATSLGTGTETFPTAFDDVKDRTTAYQEFAKLANSELGYIYVTKDRTNGETLVFDGSDVRHGWVTPDTRALTTRTVDPNPGYLLLEDGFYLLLEDGGKLILDADVTNNYTFDGTMDGSLIFDFDAPYGEHVINRMTVYAYPRRLSASNEILFQLDKEIVLASGGQFLLKGTYADPDGGLPINGQSMVTPVATTDYTMFDASGGTGNNITGSLGVSISYGADGFSATLTNNSTKTGYINKFNTRGIGIYKYNPISLFESNDTSIDSLGTEAEQLNQKYKTTVYAALVYAKTIVDEFREPRTTLNSISFIANKSSGCMLAFLYNDVGDMIYIDAPEIGIEGNHYIQGVELTINGGVAMVKWILIAALSIQAIGGGLTAISIENGAGDGINYGYLPKTADLTQRSMSVWIYPTNGNEGVVQTIMGAWGANTLLGYDNSYRMSGSRNNYQIEYQQGWSGNSSSIVWNTPNNTFANNNWYHIVITYDGSGTTNDPVIYVNAVSQTLVETSGPPSGSILSQIGNEFVIGNIHSSGYDYTSPFYGKIFDPRVYNRILSAAEVTTLYNSGTPDETLVTSGLVFQGFNVRTADLADYTDQTLTSALKVRDNQFGAIGTPAGSPIGRNAP